MRDDDKLVRQLSLVAYLMSQQRPVTADEIHEAVEGYGGMSDQAFLRRFYADRGEIEAMGLKLAVERPNEDPFQGDLYQLPAENYYLPQIDFTERELSALQTCLYLLEGQFAYAEPLRLALQHLTLGRPSPLDDHAARTVSVNLLGGDYSPEVAGHLSKIESAITRRKTIRFPYYSIGRDERSEREVDPYSLLYLGGNWYMVGLSHERGGLRIFRLSRIEGRITFKTRAEHDFPAPGELDLARYRNRPPWQFEDAVDEAVVRLSPTIAWWVEQMFSECGAFRTDDDGSALFTTEYGSARALLTWVLGLGPEAEVLEPATLREAAAAAVETVRERHSGDDLPSGQPAAPPAEPDAAAPAAPSPDKVVPAERFARLLALMTQLLAECGDAPTATLDAASVRAALNIDVGVLEDDLTLLNLINFGGGCYALYAQVEGDQIQVIKETYGDRFVRPARLSPLEAKALLWALEFIGDRLPTEADDALVSARHKVEAAIGQENLPGVEIGQAAVANTEVSAAINAAIRRDLVLDIEYWTPSRDELTPRAIEPHLLVNSRDAWYVVAFCRRARAQRTFRLDRIRGATVRDEAFTRRPEIARVEPDIAAGIGPTADETQRASVWCSPRVARWMVEEHASREHFADGSAVVEIPYRGENWVVKEVLKHQGDAVVLAPDALRRRVAGVAGRMGATYAARTRA
ncbi:MAG: WYL domain-containing protein [Thermoleophilia bacterium]|nr:WYL domain-containing protein [Thermoleophilia bacterium]